MELYKMNMRLTKVPILLFLLFSFSVYSQPKNSDESWIDVWQKSTVSLGIIDSLEGNGAMKPFFRVVGTGVIFYVKYDTIIVPCLVTAKHVLSDSTRNWNPQKIRIRFSWFDEQPVDKYFGVELVLKEKSEQFWFAHPNKKVDLACLPLSLPENLDLGNSISTLPYSVLASNEDIFEGSQILVFGYPGAIGKEFHNKALTRFGIIAYVPPKITVDSKILIDCDVFPGNSGGPVFRLPGGMQKDGSPMLGGPISFIGIVTQKIHTSNQVLITQKNTKPVPAQNDLGAVLTSLESIGIGTIEPASHVRELLKYVQIEINKK